mmetsp:Transcript_35195/g.58308  ORF Transcript_35195/g.58308 Transcript_35195/m.58308 type:complete len:304 (+) Transcript_35195:70-981(+)
MQYCERPLFHACFSHKSFLHPELPLPKSVLLSKVFCCPKCCLCIGTIAAAAAVMLVRWHGDPFHGCDRQCRFVHGFYNRSIIGRRISRRKCECYSSSGVRIGGDVPFTSAKAWNESFWCGDFGTDVVCASAIRPETTTRTDAESRGLPILHCGTCAACSNSQDLFVLNSTRTFITVSVTKCATAYARPSWMGGHRDVKRLAECLVAEGIAFTQHSLAQSAPACMDCWTDNVACDAVNCITNIDCLWKFFDPSNEGALEGCIKCDEERCGSEFIRCAGANRRSCGILSDITRPGPEVCSVGLFS